MVKLTYQHSNTAVVELKIESFSLEGLFRREELGGGDLAIALLGSANCCRISSLQVTSIVLLTHETSRFIL